MSFAAPVWLGALALVPLLLLARAHSRRRAGRYATRFPGAAVVAVAAGAVPSWRRILPAALALAAVSALVLALARPQATVAVPIERAAVVLVTDHSGSMMADDVDPTRLSAAQGAAHDFIDELPGEARVGVVTYSDRVDGVQTPTTDHDAARGAIDAQAADGATATGDALRTALDMLSAADEGGRGRSSSEPGPDPRRSPPAAIVLLSDGKTTAGRDPVAVARDAAEQDVPVYTVALGTESGSIADPRGFGGRIAVPPDPQTLAAIAEVSGGQAFNADDADELGSIYRALGSQLATRDERREITAGFALAGLVLLAGAGVASIRRLPL